MVAILGRTKALSNDIYSLPEALKGKLRFTLTENDIYRIDESIVGDFTSHRTNTDDHPYFFPLMRRAEPNSGERMRQMIRSWGNLN